MAVPEFRQFVTSFISEIIGILAVHLTLRTSKYMTPNDRVFLHSRKASTYTSRAKLHGEHTFLPTNQRRRSLISTVIEDEFQLLQIDVVDTADIDADRLDGRRSPEDPGTPFAKHVFDEVPTERVRRQIVE